MPEIAKTVSLAGVAMLIAVAAYVSARPTDTSTADVDETGQQLFPDFIDPLKAASLEIIEYDEATARPRSFKVHQVAGRWSIPSHHNYPTDAENQLADAAISVIGLKILSQASDEAGEHGLYGVLDPAPDGDKRAPGAKGVGTKVTILDSKSNKLADMIIGKEQTDRPQNRYVRRTGQKRVYLVEVSTANLSTKFEDWIEDDLLQINTWDLTQVLIDNYSIDEVQGVIVPGDRLSLAYDDTATDDKWKLADLEASEELDATKLNEMRDALDDLKIVDVARKPEGLSEGLRTEENMQIDAEALISLQRHGYFITGGQLVSNEGEVIVRMKDGVEYMLRFGEIAADADGGAGDATQGANRYVFITTRFNSSLIPLPELEALPGESPPPAPDADATDSAEPVDDPSDTTEETDPGAPCQDPLEAEPEAEIDPQPADTGSDVLDAAAPPTDATAAPPADATAAPPDEVDLQIERERIEMANQRKQEEYDELVAAGEKKAQELNVRFADWYYVISDEVYRKIRLSRADIITGGPGEDENSLQEFRRLNEEGPEGATP